MGRGQFMVGRRGPGHDVCGPVSWKPLDRSFSRLLPNSCQSSIGSTLEACPELGRVIVSSALSLHSSDTSSRPHLPQDNGKRSSSKGPALVHLRNSRG